MSYVRAWNGKWHILERVTGTHLAEPVGTWNRVAKPERTMVLTNCGLQAFSREIVDELPTRESRHWGLQPKGSMCDNCRAVWEARRSG